MANFLLPSLRPSDGQQSHAMRLILPSPVATTAAASATGARTPAGTGAGAAVALHASQRSLKISLSKSLGPGIGGGLGDGLPRWAQSSTSSLGPPISRAASAKPRRKRSAGKSPFSNLSLTPIAGPGKKKKKRLAWQSKAGGVYGAAAAAAGVGGEGGGVGRRKKRRKKSSSGSGGGGGGGGAPPAWYVKAKHRSEHEQLGGSLQRLPAQLRSNTMRYRQEFDDVRVGAYDLQQEMYASIDKQMGKLPMSFMFQYRSKEFIEERGMEVLMDMFRRIVYAKQDSAWKIWQHEVRQQRIAEMRDAGASELRRRALRRLTELAEDYELSQLRMGFKQFRRKVKRFRGAERAAAARSIQGMVRFFLGNKTVQKMRAAAAVARSRREVLMLRVVMYERIARKKAMIRQRMRVREAERRADHKKVNRSSTRIQANFRARKARAEVLRQRRLHDAAAVIQRAYRGHTGRFAYHLKVRAKAMLEEERETSSVMMQSVVRGHIGRQKARRVFVARERARHKQDRVQAVWQTLARHIIKKRDREEAMKLLSGAEQAALRKLLTDQTSSAIQFSRLVRGHLARVFYKNFRRERTEAATFLQGVRRRCVSRRFWQAQFLIKKAGIRAEAVEAQDALIPWVNKYPALVLADVGHLLEKNPGKLVPHEIATLRAAPPRWAEHERRDRAALQIQCAYRGLESRLMLELKAQLAQEAQARLEYHSAVQAQRRFRGIQGRFAAANRRAQVHCEALYKEVPMIRDRYRVDQMLAQHCSTLTLAERQTLYDAADYGREFRLCLKAARQLQSSFRGYVGRRLYQTVLAAFRAEQLRIKRYNAAADIQATARGVLVRRAENAKRALREVRALNHARYPQIKTARLRAVLGKTYAQVSMKETQYLLETAAHWREYERRDFAALRIQPNYRGGVARDRVRRLMRERCEFAFWRDTRAAVNVQRIYRARKERSAFLKLLAKAEAVKIQERYLMERRAEKEQAKWEAKLKEEEARAKILLEHKRRMEEQQLEVELMWKAEKSRIAKEMHDFVENEAQAYSDINTLNAWRQYAEADGRVYYFNSITEEQTYDPPPHWKFPNNEPKKLLYWKSLDEVKEEGCQTMTEEESMLCGHCYERTVVRECNQCISRFCMPCYLEYHTSEAMKGHTYETVKGKGAREDPETGLKICIECDEEFATQDCAECGDVFCDGCAEKVHSTGRMKEHTLTVLDGFGKEALGVNEQHCSECERRKADRLCDQCGDGFCEACFTKCHQKGSRKQHTWTEWAKCGKASGWEEYWDDEDQQFVYFNKQSKETRYTKPKELMQGQERIDFVKAQREEKQKEYMQEQLAKLKGVLQNTHEAKLKAEAQVGKFEEADEKRNKYKARMKKMFNSNRLKFGKAKKKAQQIEEEEYLRQLVVDKAETAEKQYKFDILTELKSKRKEKNKDSYADAVAQDKRLNAARNGDVDAMNELEAQKKIKEDAVEAKRKADAEAAMRIY